MLRSRRQRDRKRARLAPAGLLLSFSGAYSTVDPSAFEMPDTPANEAGVFLIFEGESPLLALSGHSNHGLLLLTQSGHRLPLAPNPSECLFEPIRCLVQSLGGEAMRRRDKAGGRAAASSGS
jgi:hypothetical protein